MAGIAISVAAVFLCTQLYRYIDTGVNSSKNIQFINQDFKVTSIV